MSCLAPTSASKRLPTCLAPQSTFLFTRWEAAWFTNRSIFKFTRLNRQHFLTFSNVVFSQHRLNCQWTLTGCPINFTHFLNSIRSYRWRTRSHKTVPTPDAKCKSRWLPALLTTGYRLAFPGFLLRFRQCAREVQSFQPLTTWCFWWLASSWGGLAVSFCHLMHTNPGVLKRDFLWMAKDARVALEIPSILRALCQEPGLKTKCICYTTLSTVKYNTDTESCMKHIYNNKY